MRVHVSGCEAKASNTYIYIYNQVKMKNCGDKDRTQGAITTKD